jgi:hypothetical protein
MSAILVLCFTTLAPTLDALVINVMHITSLESALVTLTDLPPGTRAIPIPVITSTCNRATARLCDSAAHLAPGLG